MDVPDSEPLFKLHTYFRSSCSARLRIACNLKQIPLQYSYINLLSAEQSSPAYTEINPSQSVPTLSLIGQKDKTDKFDQTNEALTITQSVAALEYLEEAFPDRFPLLPPASALPERAQVRTLVNIIACDLQPVTNLRILQRVKALGGDSAQWAKDLMADALLAYESVARNTAGQFSVGDSISLADVCLVPAVWGAQRWGVDFDALPTVMRIFESMSSIEEVDRAHWQRQPDTPENLRR